MFQIFNLSTNIEKIINSLIYVVIGILVYSIIRHFLMKIPTNSNRLTSHQQKKTKTIYMLLLNIIKYIIVILVIIAILSNFGINVQSILAGLGITTVIIGLALQDFAKDLIAGFSIITENQYEIGDNIEVDGFRGEVVSLGLKTTRIRNFKGATKIIANHKMDNLINYSLHSSLAVVDVEVRYDYNPEKIEKILLKLSDKLEGKIPKAKGKINVLGIESLEESGVRYRVTLETQPSQNFAVERTLRKEIKKELDINNIEIPYKQIEVHNGK